MISESVYIITFLFCLIIGGGLAWNRLRETRERLDKIITLLEKMEDSVENFKTESQDFRLELKELLQTIAKDTSYASDRLLGLVEKFINGTAQK